MDSLATAAAAGAEAGGSHSDSEHRQASRVDTPKQTSSTMSHLPVMGVDSSVGVNENKLVSGMTGTLPSCELNGLFWSSNAPLISCPDHSCRGRVFGA